MQALPAGGLDVAFNAKIAEPLADFPGAVDYRRPLGALTGIEVKIILSGCSTSSMRAPQGWISSTLAWTRLISPAKS